MTSPHPGSANLLDLPRAVEILRAGGLVAFPTETVYGLGGRALDPSALAKIFAAKGRPTTHPLIAHVLGEREARQLAAEWSPLATRLAEAFWPGPLTLVVPRAAAVPRELTGGGDSVAIRAPSHLLARALLEALGEPLAAPSANRYQSLSPTTAAHVAASLGDRVELILDGGPCTAGIESTVVDVRSDEPILLRPGALSFASLSAVVPALRDFVPRAVADGETRPSPGLDRRHYAPRTPLFVVRGREIALREANSRISRGERVGLLLVGSGADARFVRGPSAAPQDDLVGDARLLTVRRLSNDPEGYARELFATLHAFDDQGVDVILVEAVPKESAWTAVADRLQRAGEELFPVP